MTSVLRSMLMGAGCGLLAAAALSACRKDPSVSRGPSITGSTMGTSFRVTLGKLPDGVSEDQLRSSVKRTLDRIDGLMSTYKADSEVSRFNRSELTGWFPVSAETATVADTALEVFEESRGAFDITVAPLVDLWGFGPGKPTGQLPNSAEIDELLGTLGSRHLHVRLNPPALRKDHATLQIDLSGIAKGYAVDSIAGLLDDLGATSYLVDIGGEMRACGQKADQIPWTVAIERPEADQRSIQSTLPLRDTALATSGDYRNFFEQDGQRYSHEIDPRTGQPIRHRLVSVSVLDPSCMRADAWATALIVLGPEEGKDLAEQAGIPAFLIVKDDPGFRELETTGFRPEPP